MRLRVRHRTHYAYGEAVTTSHHEARLSPRESEHQRTVSQDIQINPAPATRKRRFDYFGNRTVHFSLSAPHRELEVIATSVVDTIAPPVPPLDATPRPAKTVAIRATPVRTPAPPPATPAATVQAVTRIGTPTPVPARRTGLVTVTARPWVEVWVDGKKVADETPLKRHVLPAGTHDLRFVNARAGFDKPFRYEVVADREVEISVDTKTGKIDVRR